MSIETEITRISTNVSDTLSAVSEMGGEVPDGATSDDMANSVRSIPIGAKIDDTTPSTSTTYSSSKIESELSALNEANAAQDTEIAKKANADDLAAVAKSGSYNDLTNKPTIPTVPSALPNPNALTFTGAVNETYDGSAAKSVAIPTVPSTLPNPNKLILSGAVTAEYDGSAPVSVEIPAGGSGSYTLPIASATQLGGVMPVAKTDEMTQPVGVDAEGKLWGLPSGGSAEWKYIRTVTVPEDITTDTSGINWVEGSNGGFVFGFDTDEDGKPFAYSEIFVRYNQGTLHTTNNLGFVLANTVVPGYGNSNAVPVPSGGGKNGSMTFGWGHAYHVVNNKWLAEGYWNGGADTGYLNVPRDWFSCDYDRFTALSVGFAVNNNGWGRVPGSEFIFYGR